MPRRLVPPPAECRIEAETALRNYTTSIANRDESPAVAPTWRALSLTRERLTTADALPVYTLGVDDILDRRRLAAAEYAGWQFLGNDPPGTTIGTEVHRTSAAGGHAFAQFNLGPFPAAIEKTLRELDSRVDASREYEVRLLRIPALHIESLWLVGERDNIVPLDPAPEPLEAGRFYEPEVFFVELEAAARENIRFDNSPRTVVEDW